jgi:asperthecin polyketide synthase
MRRAAVDSDALEAAADVILDADRHGTWHTPPHWIDGTFQLAGLVMNSFGDAAAGSPARDFFFITPGWRRLRLAEPIEAGVKYRNYVRMVPIAGEAGAYAGDIYLLRDKTVVGLCQGIKFKRVPRALMPVMFPQRRGGSGRGKTGSGGVIRNLPPVHNPAAASDVLSPSRRASPVEVTPTTTANTTVTDAEPIIAPPSSGTSAHSGTTTESGQQQNPRVAASMRLIAQETGLDAEDLRPETAFSDVGVDSLMSLTLADKLQGELAVPVKASIFLECATVGELERWLMKQA